MSWSLSASGHVSKEEEADVISKLREAVAEVGASHASISTQHHGTVNLLGDSAEDNAAG